MPTIMERLWHKTPKKSLVNSTTLEQIMGGIIADTEHALRHRPEDTNRTFYFDIIDAEQEYPRDLKDCGHKRSTVNMDPKDLASSEVLIRKAAKAVQTQYFKTSKVIRLDVETRLQCFKPIDSGNLAFVIINFS